MLSNWVFKLPARNLPKLPSKPINDSRLAQPESVPATEVLLSTCQIAFKLLPIAS